VTDIEQLLIDLINVPSTSGNEIPVAEFIESQLDDFRIHRQYVDENRFNILAQKGKSDIWFVVHMDTVPPFFSAHVTSDKIVGRGAIDNKGNLAGAIFAARQMRDINMLFTVGEEQDFIGAKQATIKGKVVVMEPTNLKIRTAQCGVIAGKIVAKGDQKHSSLLAASNENAIHVLVDVLGKLEHRRWHHFNVGIIKGGVAANVVAGSAEAEFSVRPQNRAEFSEILKTIRKLRHVEVEIINRMPPFESGIARWYPASKPTPFFSELAFFKKAVIFGAGDIAQAHTPTEFIYRADLKKIPSGLVAVARSLEAIH